MRRPRPAIATDSAEDPIKIGLTPRDFMGWHGGRELFRLIAQSLHANRQAGDRVEIARAVGQAGLGRRLARAAKRRLLSAVGEAPVGDVPDSYLREIGVPVTSAEDRQFDVVGPFGRAPSGLSVPWVGYIPDVQHRRLPGMFSKRELDTRERNIRSMLSKAPVVLVNAEDVANDLRRFYPYCCEVMVLPFAAHCEPGWFDDETELSVPIPIEPPYFLCSNQFWKHKNHKVLIEAIRIARQEGAPIRFVLTGHTTDYRHPGHYAGLVRDIECADIGADVTILGFIPKQEQIRLMRGSSAVVQPSLCEGAPGGGAIYNAIALGRPTIVSDIPVNREINGLVSHFFDAGDARHLLDKLRLIEAAGPPVEDAESLLRQGNERQRAFGLALRRAFAKACGA